MTRLNHAVLAGLYSEYIQEYKQNTLLCPWCGKPIIGRNSHMHHWLVKRSALPKDMVDKLNVVENTILVHPTCHLEYGQTKAMQDKCMEYAIKYLGEERILRWYNSLPLQKVTNLKEVK